MFTHFERVMSVLKRLDVGCQLPLKVSSNKNADLKFS